MRFLFVLFIMMPLIEIWLILKVGSLVGVPLTVVLIVLTAALGTFLLRREGFATLFRARQKMGAGALPAQEMAEGIMLAFAGALLLTPGFVTDVIGFSLLSHSVRRYVITKFSGQFQFVGGSGGFSAQSMHAGDDAIGDDVIEGEFRRDDS